MSDPSSDTSATVAKRVVSHVVCHFAVAALLGTGVAVMISLPRFIDVFADFDVELPTVTVWVLSMPPLGVLVATVVLSMLLIVAEFSVKRRAVTLTLSLVVLGGTILFDVVLLLSLFLPLVSLMRSLQ